MNNTIEKALLRQKEAERLKKEAELLNDEAKELENLAAESLSQDEPEPTLARAIEASAIKASEVEANAIEANAIVSPASAEAGSSGQSDDTLTTERFFDIDIASLEKRGFVSLHSTRSQINEEYREIKRKLLSNAFGALSKTITNANIIMVTSARPSEGKTFTAVNLALSIAAEKDKRVLLVDADVLKPNTLRTLGLTERSGLMEYLLGDVKKIGQVMFRSNIDKLRIIPAGRSHHLSTELLASQAMHDLITEFSTRYADRVVIIDTPPIIGINESAVLANFAGQAVVVVEEGRSRLSDIQKTVERLNPNMAIGFVVNKSLNTSEQTGYYGYHYYGSDREGEEQPAPKA
ncbi:XrtA-associated tyrosine autokinase [Brumicola nitratireducens]|uniref:non-specific protein-tyrosine kinase n=1 Tax=Glaciecola nitratireducens (strain JCM 12485 / KCTC 12276 / FR1064) TaxID=1085623 RepID=G4QI53_GLANF|nr:XrtA-associated tyrosine autokinase [Glaciecola nitratireducens]AEP30667.1 putative exopolysaccharide biosynthesis protein [Glaciecola nitratireducens FR1064]